MEKRILVIKLGAFGDLVLAFDAFHAIRMHHRRDHVTLLTRRAYASWARQMPWFDEVWEDPALRWWQWWGVLAWRRKLRAAGFSRVYDLQGNDRTAAYFRLLHPRPPEWSGPARGCSHPRPDFQREPLPAYERLLRQLESAGVPRAGRASLDWLTGPVEDFKLPPSFVIFVPGCSPHRPEKRWPAENYAELARRLQSRGLAVVAVGTRADQDALQTLCRLAPSVLNLAGQTDFGQLAELARRALGVVGNDTGPVHLMAAVGAPTLVLYGSESEPQRVQPSGSAVGWLQAKSLADLKVDEVWTWLQRHWFGPMRPPSHLPKLSSDTRPDAPPQHPRPTS
jgi:ADP-heptose:LPS heptosyltransferase